ncbi:hypothetical protein ACE4ZV_26405, partial [Salmonella enterica]|uniref:glycosyl hydrolase family 95 catalytic domain-containing protein n=1 Tax=Salmonella enterica TaxID=28901 RepID=UPI003D2ACB65
LYQYGRYLLLSSARRSATNLQGLWSDGPTSAWNGDYHLNINLQMNYWAVFGVQMEESFDPLIEFINRLQCGRILDTHFLTIFFFVNNQ